MGPAAAAAFLLLFGIGAPAVPRQLECPPPLVSYERTDRLALHPDPGIVYHGQHCRRADGVPEGPTVAWGADRQKLSMIGSYCGGHAQGRWSFFWGNGVLAREGSFQGASLRNGAWADYDTSGRKLVEIVYAEGREIARQEYPRSLSELPIDPEATDRLSSSATRPSSGNAARPLPRRFAPTMA